MTLAPLVNETVRGVKGKPGILGFHCARPLCSAPAQQRHHYWPKSFLRGQPYEWVSVNGLLIQNSCGLCIEHHNAVTGEPWKGHSAAVRFNEGLQLLEWWERGECIGPMKDQGGDLAPIPQAADVEAAAQRRKEDLCPGCGRPNRKEPKALPKRKSKSWNVSVPDDAEDGAVVLDEFIDDLSVAMGYGDESKGLRRYHVLVPVLYWVIQMKPEFLADLESLA